MLSLGLVLFYYLSIPSFVTTVSLLHLPHLITPYCSPPHACTCTNHLVPPTIFLSSLPIIFRPLFRSCHSIMPYNTRRKSLSLPSLGIHLPSSSRRSPSTTKSSHATDDQLPPPKKVKRSHHSGSLSPEPSTQIKGQFARPSGRRATVEHTPPPSPADLVAPKIDTEGISDDIVVGVIEQLEKTGNRPHLVKELAAILLSFNDNVAKYAPSFLLSSR